MQALQSMHCDDDRNGGLPAFKAPEGQASVQALHSGGYLCAVITGLRHTRSA